MTIAQLQIALKIAGFDPGPLDGAFGPRTRAALIAFQARHGLTPDGIAGPRTQAALTARAVPPSAGVSAPVSAAISAPSLVLSDAPVGLPWLAEASRLIGTTEIAGPTHNPAILDWAKTAQIGYVEDETPWCGLFVAHCITATLPNEPIPANPLGARQWLRFGREVAPQLGAVLVFWRGSKDGWLGHVALYWAEDATSFHVLGGNQSNAVSIARLHKSRLLGARWPQSLAPTGLRRGAGSAGFDLSTNEA